MQNSWYLVEIYCLLSIFHVVQNIRHATSDALGLGMLLGYLLFVLAASWFTFHGNRLASRLLATFIAFSALYFIWDKVARKNGFDVYRAYEMLIQAYFLAASIKLWRIKELPTRFTDPPQEPPAHH